MIVFSRRTIALLAVGISTFVAVGTSPAKHAPNVILILADDLAIGDLCEGEGTRPRTPNLDRLAKESVRFSQAYSASCVCAPARAALLTGRYPHRTGVVTLNMNDYPGIDSYSVGRNHDRRQIERCGIRDGLGWQMALRPR